MPHNLTTEELLREAELADEPIARELAKRLAEHEDRQSAHEDLLADLQDKLDALDIDIESERERHDGALQTLSERVNELAREVEDAQE